MTQVKLAKILSFGVIILLVLLPFSAFLSTWAGYNFGHLDAFRIWKELLLVPITLGSIWLVYQDKKRFVRLFKDRLVYIILLYTFLQLTFGIYAYLDKRVSASALIYALLINTRFLIFFVDCLVISSFTDILARRWRQIVFIPASIVIGFGLLQELLLPRNFLSHFGYGHKTIPAFHLVDQKDEYLRIQSTMRGPNPLGAYLSLVLTAVVSLSMTLRAKLKKQYLAMTVLGLLALFFTYSRSAWLGLFLSVASLIFVLRSTRKRRILTVVIIGIVLALGTMTYLLRENDLVQNTVFHSDEHSKSSVSSNSARFGAIGENFKLLVEEPLGGGPGTAGPASARNSYGTKIAENYFIQVGQEVGVLGLAFFASINAFIGIRLWRNRRDHLSLILFCTLVGITVINLLSHAWTDEVLSLMWWGLAGVALSGVILNKNPTPQ